MSAPQEYHGLSPRVTVSVRKLTVPSKQPWWILVKSCAKPSIQLLVRCEFVHVTHNCTSQGVYTVLIRMFRAVSYNLTAILETKWHDNVRLDSVGESSAILGHRAPGMVCVCSIGPMNFCIYFRSSLATSSSSGQNVCSK